MGGARAWWHLLLCLALAAWLTAVPTSQSAPQTSQPTYRSGVTLVPVDVRVLDKKTGMPVTDLKAEDFTVFEDDVRQEIRHFAVQSFGPAAAGEPLRGPLGPEPAGNAGPRTSSPLPVAPQTNRVFLIVLARGRLQAGPAKGLDAAAHFVRSHLRPADRVAVFAYDRATDFTTDHERVAQVIDRFKAENDAITAALDEHERGLAGIYGSRDLPEAVQARISRVFKGTGTLPYSLAGRGETAGTSDRTKRDVRRQTEDAINAVIATGRRTEAESASGPAPASMPLNMWESFDGFAGRTMQTLQDTANLYAAIAFMQRIEGEKHLIFMSVRGLTLPRLDDYADVSNVAADARVALDVIQNDFGNVLQTRAMRTLSEDTGGVASVADYGQQSFDRLDLTTSSGYLLGYSPSKPAADGKYRTIRVAVNRPDVNVLYRRRYRASDQVAPFDRQQYLTRYRIEAAARRTSEIKDIAVKMQASIAVVKGQHELTLKAQVDATRLAFALRDGARVGRLDLAIIAVDTAGQAVASYGQVLDVRIADDRFAQAVKEGVTFSLGMAIPSGTRYVRLIVYDYAADLLGTAGSWVF